LAQLFNTQLVKRFIRMEISIFWVVNTYLLWKKVQLLKL